MSTISTSGRRPLACLKQAMRQCRAERQQQSRHYATSDTVTTTRPALSSISDYSMPNYPSLQAYPRPPAGFRPSQATKQNRFNESQHKRIPVLPPPRSTVKQCPDPVSVVTATQLTTLDPTGARTRLFAKSNPERVKPGDIVLVRLRNGDPFAGVVLVIRQRNSPIDTSILLRGQLTRIGVEMWYKVYSPNIEGIEIVQRRVKRARRAKLYYMRLPKHDAGSVENVVRAYQRTRQGGASSKSVKGRDANSQKKKSKR